jgi:hypothetical protein
VGTDDPERSPEDFFDGHPDGLTLYNAVARAVGDIGEAAVKGDDEPDRTHRTSGGRTARR